MSGRSAWSKPMWSAFAENSLCTLNGNDPFGSFAGIEVLNVTEEI